MRRIFAYISWCCYCCKYAAVGFGCADVAVVSSGQRHILNEQLALPVTQRPAADFNARIIFMADQLERNLDRQKWQTLSL